MIAYVQRLAIVVLLTVAAGLSLSGCSQPHERIRIQTVEVKVPVITPCLMVEDIPALPPGLPSMPADTNAALSLSLAQNFKWKAYGREADALLRACAGIVGINTQPGE